MITTNQDVQTALNTLGYGPLTVDGIIGPLSLAAVKQFQSDHSLSVDGIPGPATKAALVAALANSGDTSAQNWVQLDNSMPPASITAVNVPPTPSSPAVSLHTNSVTGATTAKPFGTPTSAMSPLAKATGASPTAAPTMKNTMSAMTTAEWVGGAAVIGILAWMGLKKR